MKIDFINKKHRMVALQLLGWVIILGTTLFWSVGTKSDTLDTFALVVFGINIFTLIIIYLLNYKIFIPRFLFKDKRSKFFLANIIIIALLLTGLYYINVNGVLDVFRPEGFPPRPRTAPIYLARHLINYILMIGLVTALRLTERLHESEEALRVAESARVKAELANLRSQINPHFLLNTLNNIYALTAIDAEKAQKTIKELSNLLRYILYDNLNDRVSLTGEVEFLKTYIELMSIRLPRKVEVKTEFIYSPTSATHIAPLIFISLIENAFKHSVSASGEGFIDVYFKDDTDNKTVILSIKNSNHAKPHEDKSGHGIGLEQVKRRLELIYPNNYTWQVTNNNDIYTSVLTLKESI